jgi:hypothetical protein
MAFNFEWVRERDRGRIPPPKQLHARVKAVIELSKDKIDRETKLPLFKEPHLRRGESVLASIKRGDYSDPAGSMSFFFWKTTPDGRVKVDRDGLPIFGCFRGPNKTEAMHRVSAMAFGHLISGPRYSSK